jgi:hypothetical protein
VIKDIGIANSFFIAQEEINNIINLKKEGCH